MSDELKVLQNAFIKSTGIKPIGTVEEKHLPHWKRLVLDNMNCEQLERVSKFIKENFYERGTYSHLLPKLHTFNGYLCLSVDVEEIKKFLIK